jgi:hypothetical protein
MAVTLKASSGYSFGIAADETGVKLARRSARYEPEFKVYRHGLQDLIEGVAIADLKCTETIEGDINNSTGVMAMTATDYMTPTGDVTEFGFSTTTKFLMNSAEITEERGAWKSVSIEREAFAGLTA